MGMSKKSGCFHRMAAGILKPLTSSYAPTCGQSLPKCGHHTPGKIEGQREVNPRLSHIDFTLERKDNGDILALVLNFIQRVLFNFERLFLMANP